MKNNINEKNNILSHIAYKYSGLMGGLVWSLTLWLKDVELSFFPIIVSVVVAIILLNPTIIEILAPRRIYKLIEGLIGFLNIGLITVLVLLTGGYQSNLWVMYILSLITFALLYPWRKLILLTLFTSMVCTGMYFLQMPSLEFYHVSWLGIKLGLFFIVATIFKKVVDLEKKSRKETERIKDLNAKIVEHKNRTESLVQSLAEGVIMINEHGEITVLNPAARQILDISGKKVIATNDLSDYLGEFEPGKLIKGTDAPVRKEIVLPKNKIVNIACNRVIDSMGRRYGTVTVLRDITREKEMDRMKTEFISVVSHELRAPLAIIKTYVNILMTEVRGGLNAEQKNFLKIIERTLNRISRITAGLLDISRIEVGQLDLERTALRLFDVVDEVIHSFRPGAHAKEVKLKNEVSWELPPVYADHDRLIQILTNLIENAIKFTPPGGLVSVGAREDTTAIAVEVSDTGMGIPPGDLKRIFKKFHKIEVKGRRDQGVGLGLAITKEIVKMHGGEIWVKSRMGKGSQFFFTLPKYKEARNAEKNSGG